MKPFCILLLLFLSACSEEAKTASDHQTDSIPAWDSSFFAPRIGEQLLYRETIETVSELQTRPVSPEDIKKVSIKRVLTYHGLENLEGKEFHKYSIYNDGKFKEGIYFHWTGNFLLVAGSFTEDQKNTFATPPIPIANTDMTAGSYWHWPQSAPYGSGSRVIGLEPVKVPAGTFDAYKVSIKKSHIGHVTLREYWFAPKIGIVKEQNHIYSGGLLRTLNTIELTGRANSDQKPRQST